MIVLSNETNVGLPDAIGAWTFDRLMSNPLVDYAADALKRAKTKYADDDKQFARPASPRPFPRSRRWPATSLIRVSERRSSGQKAMRWCWK